MNLVGLSPLSSKHQFLSKFFTAGYLRLGRSWIHLFEAASAGIHSGQCVYHFACSDHRDSISAHDPAELHIEQTTLWVYSDPPEKVSLHAVLETLEFIPCYPPDRQGYMSTQLI